MENYDGLYGNYLTMSFSEVWEDYDSFKSDYDISGLISDVTNTNLQILYNLLYAEFKNSHISNSDVYQFKGRLFSIIWQYGPSWQKKVEFQKKIRDLSDDELLQGSKNIYNHSYNPSTEPSTATLEELNTIDDQNTTNYKKSKLEAYFQASQYLEQDFTKQFINRFKALFIKIAEPNEPLWYEVNF